jgi:hypothetical protein
LNSPVIDYRQRISNPISSLALADSGLPRESGVFIGVWSAVWRGLAQSPVAGYVQFCTVCSLGIGDFSWFGGSLFYGIGYCGG